MSFSPDITEDNGTSRNTLDECPADSNSYNGKNNNNDSESAFPYCCDIDVTFPTARHAEQTLQVMQVDQEIGNKVLKSLTLRGEMNEILRISFQATEAKLLRVVVSSFFDYLVVALKVYQEFDPTMMEDTAELREVVGNHPPNTS